MPGLSYIFIMKEKFLAITNPNDLAEFFGMTYSQLGAILYKYDSTSKYTQFSISKKTGGQRVIVAPRRKVKMLQTLLKDVMYEIYPGKVVAHGFAKGKSIVTNAQSHLDKRFVFNLDLENYFGSIHFGRVRNLFLSKPFNFNKSVATILAQICCHKNALPQGAPTSPIVANMISFKLDSQLQRLAKLTNSTYTRYADDITFSFTSGKIRLPREIVILEENIARPGEELKRIIEDNGFRINYKKVRFSGKLTRMEVTRLTINEFPNVRRGYIKQIGSMLHSWEKYGYQAAEDEFNAEYDTRHRASNKEKSFKHVVKGKLAFLQSVRGPRNAIFKKLAIRFNHSVDDNSLKFTIVEESVSELNAVDALWVIETCYDDEETGESKVAQGTGFDLESFGVITCAHVVSDKDGIFKETKAYKPQDPSNDYVVKVLLVDQHRDIAICKIVDEAGNFAPVRLLSITMHDVQQRDPVQLLGFPQHAFGKTQHYIADAKVASVFMFSGMKKFEIDYPIREGNSGGPIINQDGQLVGVALEGATKSSGNNAALSASELHYVKKDVIKDSIP